MDNNTYYSKNKKFKIITFFFKFVKYRLYKFIQWVSKNENEKYKKYFERFEREYDETFQMNVLYFTLSFAITLILFAYSISD